MKNILLYTALVKFQQTISNVKRENNEINWSKEQILLNRLEDKLGKSGEEVNKLISKDLMALLTQVPFSNR